MKSRRVLFHIAWVVLLGLTGCGLISSLGGKTVTVSIAYGSEKQAWLDPLVAQYNGERHDLEDGTVIRVEATPIGSVEAIESILAGTMQPTVWSPASSIYLPVADSEWRQQFGKPLATETPKDLVLSPVVIAMWQPMAEALGWPQKSLGWADVAAFASSDSGWETYGYPEWGKFHFGHTDPNSSNSGIASLLAEIYAGVGKQHGLTAADLSDPELVSFVKAVEDSVIHYGSSTGFFAERMFARGPSYLSAAVMYENLVVAQETKRLNGQSSQLPVVAIYPKEGTFISNHPYVILNAPWVTEQARAAADLFETFLLERPQQLKALELGFRPADVSIPFSAPLDAQHGVDPAQPKTTLEIPSTDVLQGIKPFWLGVKKPVDVVAVMDISGSMEGEKINSARESMIQFIRLLNDRDRVEIVTFSDSFTVIQPLGQVGEVREDAIRHVSGIIEGGGTALYDTIAQTYGEIQASGDPKRIRGIVVLTDGMDTASTHTSLDQLLARIGLGSEGGASIKIFTIAFGGDADKDILKRIAETTGGKQYDSSPATILKIYRDIATFF